MENAPIRTPKKTCEKQDGGNLKSSGRNVNRASMYTDNENVSWVVILLQYKHRSVPERKRIRREDDEEHQSHGSAVDEPLLDAEVTCVDEIHAVSRTLL